MILRTLSVTDDEAELIIRALDVRRNLMETGNPVLAAVDVEAMGVEAARQAGATLRALTIDQMKLILQMEALKRRLM